MQKVITPEWAKTARKAMIDREINVKQLAEALGFARTYLSNVLAGRVISPRAHDIICTFLEISDES